MVDQWAAETSHHRHHAAWRIQLSGSPTVSTLRSPYRGYTSASPPLCRVKPRYDMFKILRLPPAAAAAARQPSMPWQEWFITALPAQAGAGPGLCWGQTQGTCICQHGVRKGKRVKTNRNCQGILWYLVRAAADQTRHWRPGSRSGHCPPQPRRTIWIAQTGKFAKLSSD